MTVKLRLWLICTLYLLFVSAPCVASNVSAVVDCSNNSARVSWTSGRGASSYMVTAVGADGNLFSCETEDEWCDLTELSCGQMYHVSLTTISSSCNTETGTNVTFGTRKFCRNSWSWVNLNFVRATLSLNLHSFLRSVRALWAPPCQSRPAVRKQYSHHALGGSGRRGALLSYCHLWDGNESAVQLHQLHVRVLQLAVRRDVHAVCDCVQQHVLQWSQ